MDQAGCADRVLQQAAENAPTAWTAGRKTESSSPRAPRGLARAIAPLCGAPSRAGGGNALSFLAPPGEMNALSPFQWQGPSPLPKRCAGIRTSRGPKPPASARPAHGGRFSPAGSGAGLSWCLDRPIYRAPSRAGGETRCVSWSCPYRRKHLHRCIGRGHRPCHSAALILGPPGRALAFCCSRTCRSAGHRPARAGETRVAFPGPARTGVLADARSLWQGSSSRPHRYACIRPAGGPQPPARPPPRPRRTLAFRCAGMTGPCGTPAPDRAGGTRLAFPDPPGKAAHFRQSRKTSRPASGHDAYSADWQSLTTGVARRSDEGHDDGHVPGQFPGRIKRNAGFPAGAMPLRCKSRRTLPPQRQGEAGHRFRLPGADTPP